MRRLEDGPRNNHLLALHIPNFGFRDSHFPDGGPPSIVLTFPHVTRPEHFTSASNPQRRTASTKGATLTAQVTKLKLEHGRKKAETKFADTSKVRSAATETFHIACGDALKRLGVVAAAKAEANTAGRSTLTVVGTLHKAEVARMDAHLAAARDAAAAKVATDTERQTALVAEISMLKGNEAGTVESEVAGMYANIDTVVASISSTRVTIPPPPPFYKLQPHMYLASLGLP